MRWKSTPMRPRIIGGWSKYAKLTVRLQTLHVLAFPDFCFIVKPLQDYAKSSIYVANYNMSIPGGDLFLAREYLEKIAGSNAEEVARAKDLLKAVELKIQERQKGKGKMVDVPVADVGGETAMVTDQ
jgi:hypothetical protein